MSLEPPCRGISSSGPLMARFSAGQPGDLRNHLHDVGRVMMQDHVRVVPAAARRRVAVEGHAGERMTSPPFDITATAMRAMRPTRTASVGSIT